MFVVGPIRDDLKDKERERESGGEGGVRGI